jgi:hypothetical protein
MFDSSTCLEEGSCLIVSFFIVCWGRVIFNMLSHIMSLRSEFRVRYDFPMQTVLGSSLPPAFGGVLLSYLRYLWLLAYYCGQRILTIRVIWCVSYKRLELPRLRGCPGSLTVAGVIIVLAYCVVVLFFGFGLSWARVSIH